MLLTTIEEKSDCIPCCCQACVLTPLPQAPLSTPSNSLTPFKNSVSQSLLGLFLLSRLFYFPLVLVIFCFLVWYIDSKDGHQLRSPPFYMHASTPIEEWSIFLLASHRGLDIVPILKLLLKRPGSCGFCYLGSSRCRGIHALLLKRSPGERP